MARARSALLPILACAATPLVAATSPEISTSPIWWAGAEGHTIHGYMAIPGAARMQQPAVLVLADDAAGGQAAAHRMVDAIARAGFLACTPRGDERRPDLLASLAWLRTNRYSTGRVAVVALGDAAATKAATLRESDVDAPLLAFGASSPRGAAALALPLPAPGAELSAAATAFLKEHLR